MEFEKLKKHKEKNNLSWYRISRNTGIPTSTIFNWKYNIYKPSRLYKKIIMDYVDQKDVDNPCQS
jgi:hypothetical protein